MIIEQCENENKMVAKRYGQKGDKRSFGRWETFLVSTVHTKTALVAYCTGFNDRYVALLSCLLEAKLIAFFCSRWSLKLLAQNVPDKSSIDKTQRYFLLMSATLSSLYEGWLHVLLHRSQLPESSFFHVASRTVNNCSAVTPTNSFAHT